MKNTQNQNIKSNTIRRCTSGNPYKNGRAYFIFFFPTQINIIIWISVGTRTYQILVFRLKCHIHLNRCGSGFLSPLYWYRTIKTRTKSNQLNRTSHTHIQSKPTQNQTNQAQIETKGLLHKQMEPIKTPNPIPPKIK